MIKLSNSDGNWFELSIHKNGDFVGNSDVIKKKQEGMQWVFPTN